MKLFAVSTFKKKSMYANLSLYKIEPNIQLNGGALPTQIKSYNVVIHQPTLLTLNKYNRSFIVNLFWWIASFGRFKILFLKDNKTIVHQTYITPKVYRFPFMKKDDIQIGPCRTNKEYQKKGIYTDVLKAIVNHYSHSHKTIWIYSSINNNASQKAFVSAGFMHVADVKMSRISKIIFYKN